MAPYRAGIFNCWVAQGKGKTSHGPLVCAPFGVGQLPYDVVPDSYLCLCFDDMMFVAEGAVKDNPKVH